MEKNPHHLILGELTDYLTEETLADTHDERLRQKLSGTWLIPADLTKNRSHPGNRYPYKPGKRLL